MIKKYNNFLVLFILCAIVVSNGCTSVNTSQIKPSYYPDQPINIDDDLATSSLPSMNSKNDQHISSTIDSDSTTDEEMDTYTEVPPDTTKKEISEKESSRLMTIQAELDSALKTCETAQELWEKGDLENAIRTLDQAFMTIINLDTLDIPKFNKQKDELRFMISKRILEIHASRHFVVKGKYKAIPIVLNKDVQSEIDRYLNGERGYFQEALNRSGRYRAIIVEELKKAGIPEELSWLPLIESGFKLTALSPARALGMWQFIPSTGYKYGLKRDHWVDERIDPLKATKAAISYLSELHEIFGDWSTVLAAYNCGEYRVLRVIREQNINYLDNFWDLYKQLPRETARYVPRFFAALTIVNNLKKYGFTSDQIATPIEYEEVLITKQLTLKEIGEAIGVDYQTLKELNPELRYQVLPKYTYALKVPSSKADLLLAVIDELDSSHRQSNSSYRKFNQRTIQPKNNRISDQPAFINHFVKSGETLFSIAKKYGITFEQIQKANTIKKETLVEGSLIIIPKINKKNYTDIQLSEKKHAVKRGETLWIISKRYGTTPDQLKRLNNLTSSYVHSGQILYVPTKIQQPMISNIKNVYQVKHGDNLRSIAMQHNMSLDRFLDLNQLSKHSRIYPGQTLYIE